MGLLETKPRPTLAWVKRGFLVALARLFERGPEPAQSKKKKKKKKEKEARERRRKCAFDYLSFISLVFFLAAASVRSFVRSAFGREEIGLSAPSSLRDMPLARVHINRSPFFVFMSHNPPIQPKYRRGSRVIFPNGAIDPWHALGVLEAPIPDLPVIYVEGERCLRLVGNASKTT